MTIEFKEILEEWNPWWFGGEITEKRKRKPRQRYLSGLTEEISQERVSIITGPRRSGKTTLIFQVIDHLLKSGVDGRKVLFASMDHPGISENMTVGDVFREFKQINDLKVDDKTYIFLDEVHFSKDWVNWVKSIHDMGNTKVFVSGSTTVILEKDAFASLTGRWRKTSVWPLDIREYLDFKGKTLRGGDSHLKPRYLIDYARTGGFPEAVLAEDDEESLRIRRELFDDMIFKDAARIGSNQDLHLLRQVALLMLGGIGAPLSINKMRNIIKTSFDNVSRCVDSLCRAYLFFPVEFHSRSLNERTYNPKKYYCVDTGLAWSVLGRMSEGIAIENILAIHFLGRGDVHYWRSGSELDFIIEDGEVLLESKYKNDITRKDITGGLGYSRKNLLSDLFVSTKDHCGELEFDGINVHLVPAMDLLLDEKVLKVPRNRT